MPKELLYNAGMKFLAVLRQDRTPNKYGYFTCPVCKAGGQPWKFSANVGNCDNCGGSYQAGLQVYVPGRKTTSNHLAVIETLN